jgi:hypothetical protein
MAKSLSNTPDGWILQVKRYIADGKDGYRLAAARIEAVRKKDPKLTQKTVAKSIGKSETWVSRLLTWYRAGCPEESIFEGQHSPVRASIKAMAKKGPKGLDQEFIHGKLMRDGPWVQQQLPIDVGARVEAPSIVPKAIEQSDATLRFLEVIGACRNIARLLNGYSRDAMLAACGSRGTRARSKLEAFRREVQTVERVAALAADEASSALGLMRYSPDFV